MSSSVVFRSSLMYIYTDTHGSRLHTMRVPSLARLYRNRMDVLRLFDYLMSMSKHPWGRRDQEPIRSCYSSSLLDNVWIIVIQVYRTFALRCLRIVG